VEHRDGQGRGVGETTVIGEERPAADRVDDQLYAGRSVDADRDNASRLARSSARVESGPID
jgi:hypothetical protein